MYRMKEKFLGTLHFVAARKLDIQKLKYWFIVAQASYFRIKLMLDSFSKYQIVETSLTEMLMCLCDCLYIYQEVCQFYIWMDTFPSWLVFNVTDDGAVLLKFQTRSAFSIFL
jgi:hypothetical protein